ncbi:UNVERIFIED_ORG: uncharacterized membrane protein (DUF485 family) [Mycolicibacterium obuense]
MSETDLPPREAAMPSGDEYLAMQASPEFQELRKRLRGFVFPMSAAFLIWYTTYVLLSTFATDFMAIRVFGNINVGLLIGIGQFVTTFLITGIYVRFANKVIDPRAAAIRAELEGHAP